MNKQLDEIKDILITIFDIDAFLATFRFYYNALPITCIADIPTPEIDKPIDLEVEFTGG